MKEAPSIVDGVWMAGVAALCALAAGVALTVLSRPSGLEDRLEGIERRADQTAQLLRPRREVGLAPDAVCTGDIGRQVATLRSAVSKLGAEQDLELSSLDIAPEAPGRSGLTPVRIRFEASGGYEAALTLLDRMGRIQPQVFADTVDLVSQTSSVDLSFSGRVFCAG